MRLNRTLALGILGCLGGGLVIGASQATVEGGVDDSPMTVPVSRIGDRVTYAHFQRLNDIRSEPLTGKFVVRVGESGLATFLMAADQPDSPKGDRDPEVPAAFRTFEATMLANAMDQTAKRHEVLVVSSNFKVPGQEPGPDRTVLEFIERQSRFTIQRQSLTLAPPPVNWTLSSRVYAISEPSLPGLELQGQTIALGDDLTRAHRQRSELAALVTRDPAGPAREAPMGDDRSGDMHLSETSRRWVADRGIVDGRDAYAVRTEHRVTQKVTAQDRDALQQLTGKRLGDTATMVDRQTLWVGHASAYPILVETFLSIESGDVKITVNDAVDALQEVRIGTGGTVTWGTDAQANPFQATNEDAERTPPGQLYPADGTGSRLAYGLAQAIADVESDARLAPFQLWRQQNPNHYLVAADLTPGERTTGDLSSSMWRLVFATTSGSAFEVTTERLSASMPALTESRGGRTVTAFKVSDLPAASPTLASVAWLWLDQAGEPYESKAPNYVHWGLRLSQESGAGCVTAQSTRTFATAPGFAILEVGYTNQGSCVQEPGSHDQSFLAVDTKTGNMQSLFEWRFKWNRQVIGSHSSTSQAPEPAPKKVFTGVKPPEPQKAAGASTSLLAAFLLLYFLPVLKFAGAKGLFLLPGFAKLRKAELLDNDIRDQIMQVVRDDPGVSTTELQERVQAGWGTIVYHVGVLEKNGFLTSLVDGRYHRFFPVGTLDFSQRGQVAVMKNDRTKQIYDLILQEPGVAQDRLASRAGISAPAAIFHLKRLEDVGMVGRVKRGRKVHYYPNQNPRLPATTEGRDAMEVA